MHQDERRAVAARDLRETRLEAQPTNIIQNVRAGAESLLGDLGFGGVNGDGDRVQLAPQAANDGQHAPQFFLPRDRLRAGPCGFAAHVDPVGSLANQFHPALDGAFGSKVESAIRERVRGHVEHAHEERTVTKTNRSASNFDLELGAKSHVHGRSRRP